MAHWDACLRDCQKVLASIVAQDNRFVGLHRLDAGGFECQDDPRDPMPIALVFRHYARLLTSVGVADMQRAIAIIEHGHAIRQPPADEHRVLIDRPFKCLCGVRWPIREADELNRARRAKFKREPDLFQRGPVRTADVRGTHGGRTHGAVLATCRQ